MADNNSLSRSEDWRAAAPLPLRPKSAAPQSTLWCDTNRMEADLPAQRTASFSPLHTPEVSPHGVNGHADVESEKEVGVRSDLDADCLTHSCRNAVGECTDESHLTYGNLAQHITLDADPVVPPGLLHRISKPVWKWRNHRSHFVVLLLLQQKGLYYPRNRDIYNYHMAELFLHYVDICREGSYFIHYSAQSSPKERFFRIRLCGKNWYDEEEPTMLPCLMGTLHKSGSTVTFSAPLHELVGVQLDAGGPHFAPFLRGANQSSISGCIDSRGHRAVFSTSGAFRLLFYSREEKRSYSVDLLTCDPNVYAIWTVTFRGVLSVNSSSVVQVPLSQDGYTTVEMEACRRAAFRDVEEQARIL